MLTNPDPATALRFALCEYAVYATLAVTIATLAACAIMELIEWIRR